MSNTPPSSGVYGAGSSGMPNTWETTYRSPRFALSCSSLDGNGMKVKLLAFATREIACDRWSWAVAKMSHHAIESGIARRDSLSLMLDAKSIRKFIIISTRSGNALTLTPPLIIWETGSATIQYRARTHTYIDRLSRRQQRSLGDRLSRPRRRQSIPFLWACEHPLERLWEGGCVFSTASEEAQVGRCFR